MYKYNIVQIGKKYALRREKNFIFFKDYDYKDLRNRSYWWGPGNSWFEDCLSDDIEEVEQAYKLFTVGEIIIK